MLRNAYLEHESALGCWRTCGWVATPGDPLGALVETIWYFEGYTALLRERHFPDGRYTIIMQFGTPHRPVEGESYEHRFPAACFSGMAIGSQVIEAPSDRMCVMGINLTPLGAFQILGRPLDDVSGFTSDLADLIGFEARTFEGRLRDLRSGPERVSFALEWVRKRLIRNAAPDARVAWAYAAIDRGDLLRMAPLRAQSGIDKTRFIRHFHRAVGATPKRFSSIVRVRTALHLLCTGRSIADVAASTGYYDQAHFGNEMRRLTGLTPREYVTARRYPNSPSVAEPGPYAEDFPRPEAPVAAMLGA